MEKTKNQEIQAKIDGVINEIVQCGSKVKRKELLERLLSLKGQYDVVPMLYDLPVDSIVKEYDFGTYTIIKTNKFIVYHNRGGMGIVISPRMKCLYEFVDHIIGMKDNYETLTDEEKKGYELLLLGMSTIFTFPCYAPVDDNFFSIMVSTIIGETQKLYERQMAKPLQPETPMQDAKFENELDLMQEAAKL